ncbi:cupin domain-containing protein [Pelomonas aquatica]|jgi:quercetin dioxygenase-like cupin family protein|uniref:ChrR-like cupin domain-containing protein n=1 Tax=Pelomonas aquatica TaxID=431058 RepID=A0A9X4LDV5_9BURK|nr:cupin domain-containing protein [Pelomonas aquatica]MCY4753948.1 cupin domain-containing protein [Pelomonas aquatica]MDG0861274.1 hypothetical protein [Pelomonas aquatica]
MTSTAATPAQARAIRRRLLERVADTDDSHLTVPAGAAGWQPFGDGVQIKILHESEGILSYLLRFAPGARLDAHRHPVDEECLVLEGVLKVGSRIEVGAGGYHLARAGSLHAGISTEAGATIFLRGAEPQVDQLLV